MSDAATFSCSSSKSQTSAPQVNPLTCDPSGTFCQRMAESQTEEGRDASLIRTPAVTRRHSVAGSPTSASGSAPGRTPVDPDRFHPYRRQFSEGAVLAAGSPPFSCLQEDSYPELSTLPVEHSCFLSQSYPSYSSSSPLQQVSSRLYPSNEESNISKYSFQIHSHQESTTQSLFPKPIYSYSILIFLALKNSKTGSLPVSEIYSFMTEHFPYFKSAPDGWKNSVRHNLSLNKCFEKVENKNGNSSRKGCLWALNPAKVEKMQEELHKWRRKDPVTVRRSMARPEDLDRLLGQRPERLRSVPPYINPALLSRVAPIYGTASSSSTPAQLRAPFQRPQYTHFQPQQPCFLPPAAAHPSNSFALYSPCGQQPAAGVPSAAGSLRFSMAGKIPPVDNATMQAEYSSRTMQDLLLEGDASYDIDTLNPSLTDLQLQGNLWEELQDDSLVTELQVTTKTSTLQDQNLHTSCPQVTSPCRKDIECEDGSTGRHSEQHGCLNGLHPVAYSGLESLAGYLTSGPTSISLI